MKTNKLSQMNNNPYIIHPTPPPNTSTPVNTFANVVVNTAPPSAMISTYVNPEINTFQPTSKYVPAKQWHIKNDETTNSFYNNSAFGYKTAKKYKYTSPDGKKLAAGGVLLFEQTTQGKGIWVIEEEDSVKGIVHTDIGGRYNYDDGDIIATISREFREETYNVHEISFKDLKELPTSHYVYVDGYDKTPSYLCIVAHVNQFNISFNPQKIRESRKKILLANPDVSGEWYKTIDVKFLLLKDIIGDRYKLSRRLYVVLQNIANLNNQEIRDFFKDFKL